MITIINVAILIILIVSLILNWTLIFRISCADADFYLDKTDPDNVKPVIKFDLDDVENKPFFIVKVLKDKDSRDKN